MRVQIRNEVKLSTLRNEASPEWDLCFQLCRYIYDDDGMDEGYRFIWRRPNGNLQAARGQARIPSIKIMNELANRAIKEGWGGHEF